jgi:hypothetical protein
VSQKNPTEVSVSLVWVFITCITIIAWSVFSYLGYSMRLFLYNTILKNRDSRHILLRSERQGLLLGLLLGMQLALQGFLLFNILSATILTIAVFLLEFFFIAQENK